MRIIIVIIKHTNDYTFSFARFIATLLFRLKLYPYLSFFHNNSFFYNVHFKILHKLSNASISRRLTKRINGGANNQTHEITYHGPANGLLSGKAQEKHMVKHTVQLVQQQKRKRVYMLSNSHSSSFRPLYRPV